MRSRRTVRFLAGALTAALAATLSLGGCDRLHVRQAPDHIAFSVPPRDEAQNLERRWKPLLDDMQAQTGLKVSPYFAPGYDPAVEALKLDRVQAGLFSNSSGQAAVRHGAGEVFASVDLAPDVGFASVLMVRTDRPITLDQVLHCGRRFSFGLGVPGSTSATLAPLAELFAPHGIEPNACFKAVRRAGHTANILSVASGDLDLAVSDTAALAMTAREHPEIASKIKVLWTSPPLPREPLLWRRDLDPSVKEKLRAFFLGYGKAPGAEGERQRKVLADLGLGGFEPADDSHFLPVREMQARKELLEAHNAHDARATHAAEAELARIRRAEVRAAAEGGRARSAAPSGVELQGVSGRSGG